MTPHTQRPARSKPRTTRLGARPREPKIQGIAYARDLASRVRAVWKAIKPLLPGLEKADGHRMDAVRPTHAELIAKLRLELEERFGRQAIAPVVDTQIKRVEVFNARDVRRQLGASRKTVAAVPRGVIERLRTENVKLITSIPKQLLGQVSDVLRAADGGARAEFLAVDIAERFGVSESRAELIATDQTLKMNAAFTEERHIAAGIDSYMWSTSRDQKVRPMHADLEGTTQRYSDPPVTNEDGDVNNPGEEVLCRCIAVAILDT